MARTKGSKNKAGEAVNYEVLLDENASAIETTTAKIAALEDEILARRLELRTAKIDLRKLEKGKARLETKKAAFDAAREEEQKKAEVEDVVAKLMSDGMTADEILEMLK